MGQYSVLESPESSSTEQFSGQSGTNDARRVFNVAIESDPTFETSETVKIFSKLPKVGDVHHQNAAKICTGVEVQQRSQLYYDAVASYALPQTVGSSGSLKPWQQPPDIKYSFAITEEPVDVDANGKPMIMKTGESFEPPIRRPVGDLVITVVRNVLVFSAPVSNKLLWHTSSDGVFGFAPGQALITHLEAEQIYYQPGKPTQTIYYRRSSAVQFREPKKGVDPSKAWYHRQIAAGYYWNVPRNPTTKKVDRSLGSIPANVKLERAFDELGHFVTKPVLHNKDTGFPIFSDNNTITYNPTNAQWYEFKIYQDAAFNGAPIL